MIDATYSEAPATSAPLKPLPESPNHTQGIRSQVATLDFDSMRG